MGVSVISGMMRVRPHRELPELPSKTPELDR